MLKIRLASAPYNEPRNGSLWPVTHCDGYLLQPAAVKESLALIQLVGNGFITTTLPTWREGDIVTLTPMVSAMWNDSQQTGRCYVALYLRATCENRPGMLEGMIPVNPDRHDFSRDESKLPT